MADIVNLERISTNRTLIMGVAALSIVLTHQRLVSYPFYAAQPFLTWAVDVFMFLSGFGVVNSLRKNTIKQFFLNRGVRIIPVLLVSSIILTGILHYKEAPLFWFIWGVYEIVSFWFVNMILVFYLLTPILVASFEKYKGNALVVTLAVPLLMSVLLFTPQGCSLLTSFLGKGILHEVIGLDLMLGCPRLCSFALGVWLSLFPEKVDSKLFSGTSATLFFVLAAVLRSLYVWLDYPACCYYFSYYAVAFAIPAICTAGARVLSKVILVKPIHCFFAFFGALSLEVYLVHRDLQIWLCSQEAAWLRTLLGSNVLLFVVWLILICLFAYITNLICRPVVMHFRPSTMPKSPTKAK